MGPSGLQPPAWLQASSSLPDSFERSLGDWGFPSSPPGTVKPERDEAGGEAVAPDLSCSLAKALQRGFSCVFFLQL